MKMTEKKLFLILIAVLLSLTAGCRNMLGEEFFGSTSTSPAKETESPVGSPGTSETIQIKMYQYKPEYNDAVEKAAAEFSKENEKIKITVKSAKSGEDYMTTLKTLLNSGDQPDLFNIGRMDDLFELKDKLSDLSDLEAVQYANKDSLKGVAIEDKIYGTPYNMEGFGFIYNKEMFEKAEIDIPSLDSFMALEDAVKKLDKQKENIKIEAVFAFPVKDFQITGIHMSNAFISPEFEGDVLKVYQSKNIEFILSDAFRKLVDLQLKYSVTPVSEIDNKKQIEYFVDEKIAIILQGNWIYSMIEAKNKEFAEKIDMLPFFVDGLSKLNHSVGVPMYWAINNSSKEEVKEACKDFLNWLYISDGGEKIIREDFKFVPAYMAFAADVVKDPLGKCVFAKSSTGDVISYVFMGYPNEWGTKTLGADIYRYANGELSWDKVIENAKKEWNKQRQ
ncbi:MAG: carbohydrate ABC transporter substrate-binding protein [Clostridiaceae bacterium]|nr:carbohydrate ABC transporter substrate-binding protein [Clostridiaceae bacterium]